MFTRFGAFSAAVVVLAAATLPLASCADEQEVKEEPEPSPSPNAAVDLISIPGMVVSFSPNSFLLDYGRGRVTVRLGDWDLYGEAGPLSPGDRVQVRGEVDEKLFGSDVIKPTSIFIDKLDSYFYPGPAPEVLGLVRVPPARLTGGGVDYIGRVTGADRNSFTLGSGITTITVDTRQLVSPLVGTGRIEPGDRVYVWGNLDMEERGRSKLLAKGLVELIGSQAAAAQARPIASASPMNGR